MLNADTALTEMQGINRDIHTFIVNKIVKSIIINEYKLSIEIDNILIEIEFPCVFSSSGKNVQYLWQPEERGDGGNFAKLFIGKSVRIAMFLPDYSLVVVLSDASSVHAFFNIDAPEGIRIYKDNIGIISYPRDLPIF